MKIIYSILLILFFASCTQDNKVVNLDNVKYIKIFYMAGNNPPKYISEADNKRCINEDNLIYIGTLDNTFDKEEIKYVVSCFYTSEKYEPKRRIWFNRYLKIPPYFYVLELDNKKRIYLNNNFFSSNKETYEFTKELNINFFKLSR